MQPPTGYPDLVPGVTVIVPHGGADRLALLEISLRHLREAAGAARIVLVELDEVPHAADVGRRLADFYVFAPSAAPFHKTRAMNIGLAFVRTTHFLWLDNDLLLPERFVVDAWRECVERGLDCLLPWSEIHYLSEADSRAVAMRQCAPGACVPVQRFTSNIVVPGGAVLVRTAFAHQHGGMPEQFRGWGCEDSAWFIKVRMLGSIGVAKAATRVLYHLYHATSGGYDRHQELFARPEYRRNFAMLGLLKSYQTPEAFSRRFPAPTWFSAPWLGTSRIACAPGAEAIGQVLRELYNDAVSLCDPDATADATLPATSSEDAWDAALAAVCRMSIDSNA